jgi:hypothetical protein
MEVESTTFGTITMGGKTYEHDVVVRLSGDVVKRKKKLSKKYYGTSHILSKEEARFVFENDRWFGPNWQCASIAESQSLFREKELQGSIGADPRGHPSVQ